jgi:riboflavin biosynthesis pyrimidine reductase
MKLLYEQPGLPSFKIPGALRVLYGGDLGFAQPRVLANFVASVDGVVALPVGEESGGVISRGSETDHFVMGLLRASAGAVLIGAGTFRKGEGFWDAESIYPQAAGAFVDLRRQLGLPPRPMLAVVSASGDLDVSRPALQRDAVIITTARGQARLGKVPGGLTVLIAPETPIRLAGVLASLRAGTILCEGGPTLVGQLIGEGLLDELFLTRSPFLFGRRKADDRKSLVEGMVLAAKGLELLSLRQHESYLFLRYALVPGQRH